MNRKYDNSFDRKHLLKSVMGGVGLTAATAWLFLANLGCNVWQTLNTFYIELVPTVFLADAPGRVGTIRATLIWANERELEAKTWAVDQALPEIVFGASCDPQANSEYTDVVITTSPDLSKFAASDLWVASAATTFQVGIRATFVDPLWKSLSEGHEAVIARKKFIPVKAVLPEPWVILKQVDDGMFTFEFGIRNYSPKYNYLYQLGGGSYEELSPGKTISFMPIDKYYTAVFELEAREGYTVIRSVREVFHLQR